MIDIRSLLVATMMFLLVSAPGWATPDTVCFFRTPQERLYVDRDQLAFDIQDSGKVQVITSILRVEIAPGKSEVEHLERVRFAFSLPALPTIVSGAPVRDGYFFPAFATEVPWYRELLRFCVREQLFPKAVTQRSDFLR
ncbi:MAG TPA: hypothetical protein PKM25_10155 [Candidatus Ozemobacteraceae bacterium]|nr:hypothetical protein [Candidatus Ozemobacteraceae bacterium]